ncbi:MAG TPA: EcsC family protein [Turneriella sp.]|nr:EcsC family protein [Turneriella sp.]HMY10863.1 EcsC family protein [Turneriella sp.]HNE18476.1 EcsC family protein [Turneriella sp.]HNJ65952.1 EcsC family protein [Turneriella sp.]HNL09096.1 EcsC family protein [Turneriella sp.]
MDAALPQDNPGAMERLLDSAYGQVLNGFGVFTPADRLAQEYLAQNAGDARRAAADLIGWQMTKAAASGFVTNLGGIGTLPVAIPANVSSVIYLQLRMVAAIAIMAGYDVRSDKVRTLIYVTLLGSAAAEVLKEAGIKLGQRITTAAIMRLTGQVARRMTSSAAARLMARLGLAQAGNLARLVPVAGGLIAGATDAAATKAIGLVATQVFLPVTEENPTGSDVTPGNYPPEQIG